MISCTSPNWCVLLSTLLALALSALVGCNDDSEGIPFSGHASIDGVPLSSGTVFFHPEHEGKGASANIVDGRFEVSSAEGLTAGDYRVEVFSEKETGRQISNPDVPDQMMEETVQIIPQRYNINSELTANVSADMPELKLDLEGR